MKKIRGILALLLAAMLLFTACGEIAQEVGSQILDVVIEELSETEHPSPEEAAAEEETAIPEDTPVESVEPETTAAEIDEDGTYTTKEDVALYLHLYGHLPSNFITKKEAQKLGWDNKLGNLDKVAPGKSIGGDYFGNYEGILPEQKGREYHECDIDFDGGYRNGKRIVFSNDGLVYYTEDHYETFELLYGEE